MAYEIHIERPEPLTLAEWKAAVKQQKGLRLDSAGASATNPKTGETISIGGTDGDVAMRIDGKWIVVFHWRKDSVAFRAPSDFASPDSEIRQIALRLAKSLNAKLVGDEGEEYD
jgi:hypothetical protein